MLVLFVFLISVASARTVMFSPSSFDNIIFSDPLNWNDTVPVADDDVIIKIGLCNSTHGPSRCLIDQSTVRFKSVTLIATPCPVSVAIATGISLRADVINVNPNTRIYLNGASLVSNYFNLFDGGAIAGVGSISASVQIRIYGYSEVIVGDFPLASCKKCWPGLPPLMRYGDFVFTSPMIIADAYTTIRMKNLVNFLEHPQRTFRGLYNDRVVFEGRLVTNGTAFVVNYSNNTEDPSKPEMRIDQDTNFTWPINPVLAMWQEVIIQTPFLVQFGFADNQPFPRLKCSTYTSIFPAVPIGCPRVIIGPDPLLVFQSSNCAKTGNVLSVLSGQVSNCPQQDSFVLAGTGTTSAPPDQGIPLYVIIIAIVIPVVVVVGVLLAVLIVYMHKREQMKYLKESNKRMKEASLSQLGAQSPSHTPEASEEEGFEESKVNMPSNY